MKKSPEFIGTRAEPELIVSFRKVAESEERTPAQLLRLLMKERVEAAAKKRQQAATK